SFLACLIARLRSRGSARVRVLPPGRPTGPRDVSGWGCDEAGTTPERRNARRYGGRGRSVGPEEQGRIRRARGHGCRPWCGRTTSFERRDRGRLRIHVPGRGGREVEPGPGGRGPVGGLVRPVQAALTGVGEARQ